MKQSGEDYLESILRIQHEKGSVRSIDIVHDLGVSKPSVSVAVHNLEQSGHIEIIGHELKLTDSGREIAERVMERHELFYQFLVDMGVDEQTAETDACHMEHALSEASFQAIKSYLQQNPVK